MLTAENGEYYVLLLSEACVYNSLIWRRGKGKGGEGRGKERAEEREGRRGRKKEEEEKRKKRKELFQGLDPLEESGGGIAGSPLGRECW